MSRGFEVSFRGGGKRRLLKLRERTVAVEATDCNVADLLEVGPDTELGGSWAGVSGGGFVEVKVVVRGLEPRSVCRDRGLAGGRRELCSGWVRRGRMRQRRYRFGQVWQLLLGGGESWGLSADGVVVVEALSPRHRDVGFSSDAPCHTKAWQVLDKEPPPSRTSHTKHNKQTGKKLKPQS